MTGTTALIYDDAYLSYQFGPDHPLQPTRVKYTLDLIKEFKLLNGKARLYSPKAASEEDLRSVHSPEYVNTVKRMSAVGRGFLDSGDTPATKGIFEAACSVVGGSILGADLIMKGEVRHAFNPGGGHHHAKRDGASGFSVFNDIAIAVRRLQRRYGVRRVAIIDIDGHHADGTQEIFYKVCNPKCGKVFLTREYFGISEVKFDFHEFHFFNFHFAISQFRPPKMHLLILLSCTQHLFLWLSPWP
ncbi:MAG: hypothetical protein ACE5Z5_03570 [Candidatus Bathyarchaeia archaeon]